MALDSFTNLKAEIVGYLERSDLTEQVETFIDLCEARLRRECRIRQLLTTSTVTLAQGASTISLPADFLDLKLLRIQAPSSFYGLRYMPGPRQTSSSEMAEVATNYPKVPEHYAFDDNIEFDSAADQEYTVELLYYKEPTPLSLANESNEVLVAVPDVYLYGSLSASAPFLMHDERIPIWEQLYSTALRMANKLADTSRHGGPLISRPQGYDRGRYGRV